MRMRTSGVTDMLSSCSAPVIPLCRDLYALCNVFDGGHVQFPPLVLQFKYTAGHDAKVNYFY